MKLIDIINIIEENYPKNLSYEWDNAGLFFGDKNKDIKRVIVTLDITMDVINQALEENADLILSHHPVIMSGIKTLEDNLMHSEIIKKAIKNDLAIYSAHTNMDVAKNGINQKLAELFGFGNIEVLEENPLYKDCGLGRVGELEKEISIDDFCEIVKEKLNTPFVRLCKNKDTVKRVCVASGSCCEYVPLAIEKKADVIITGDMKYHNCIEYVYDGISIIDAGHFPTEIIVMDMFSELLKNENIDIIKSKNQDIFKIR